MERRYLKNMKMLSEDDILKLKGSKVSVVGCGGLGGYVIEMLARIGVGKITAIDGDVFDETNLNRQLFSHTDNLGKSKAESAKTRINLVNPLVEIEAFQEKITSENGNTLLKNHHVIVDAVDNIATRLLLQQIAAELNIPLVHGAIAGWYGQVTTIFPEDQTLNQLYPKKINKGIESELGNPSFTPALVAAIEVAETVKILLQKKDLLRRKVLKIDLLSQEYIIIDLI
ncbi:MAG TPA: HesA/MoeB/ThiF family protein [Bacillota bacterium]|nr:HesA/MoeB/ThiF family protein [Bacillota bacterium]HOL10294.1 HesA/MoeB/ThiF family protein [Bacillota bacterium]HPO97412.1 HesA/MoeB/ThiF family protein [Bacillota bacterium]